MTETINISTSAVWKILEQVNDPEVLVLSVIDLGIVRDVEINNDEVIVTVTPTYSGCPATEVINMSIRLTLIENGFKKVQVKTILSPAWTTEWMTDVGKEKLRAYGIAPPKPM